MDLKRQLSLCLVVVMAAVAMPTGAQDSPVPPIPASARYNAPAAATVGVASAQVLAANTRRRAAVFINTSANTISCAVAATAVLNSGVTLPAGAAWNMGPGFLATGAVNCIASMASSNLSVQEMQ